jgi:hypothetical protein
MRLPEIPFLTRGINTTFGQNRMMAPGESPGSGPPAEVDFMQHR